MSSLAERTADLKSPLELFRTDINVFEMAEH